ncbi:hypothetical protein KY362_01095 [Candidatus Woesearchaeota archaeon]|nr:hypothetical protein [Candidatus Woesearchaeota archaeon]
MIRCDIAKDFVKDAAGIARTGAESASSPLFRMLTSRKAQAFNKWVMAFVIIICVFVLFLCVWLLNLFINYRFDVTDVQGELLVNGLLYGTGGISYYDPMTGRIYPEIIYPAQLSEKELDMGMYYPENNLISARITITKDSDQSLVRELYYNKHWFENWEPLLPLEHLPGIGGVKSYSKRMPVLLMEENYGLYSGHVDFLVVQPKSARSRRSD